MAATKKPTMNMIRAGTVGKPGLRATGGFVWDEPQTELRGQAGARTYRQMADTDETVGAILFAFNMLLRNVEWTVQAASDDGEDEEMAELVDRALRDMATPMTDIIDEVTSMFTYGYAPMEITWKRRDGRSSRYDDNLVMPHAISLRSQQSVERWVMDDSTGEVLGLVQQALNGPSVEIPIEKMMLFRTTAARNNPEGRSVLRNAYRPWVFKKRIQEIEGIGVERDLAGLPVAYIPIQYFSESAPAEDRVIFDTWKEMVKSVRRDAAEGLVIPSVRDEHGNLMFEFKLLNSGGTRTLNTDGIISRYDRGIATSVLADFIFLGQQAVGSFALSSDKTALFAAALGGFIRSIASVFNQQLLARIWRYNGFDVETMPVIVPGDIEQKNLAELAQYVTSLAGAGAVMFPDRELENYLRKAGGLPPAPESGDELGPMPMQRTRGKADDEAEEVDEEAGPAAPGQPAPPDED